MLTLAGHFGPVRCVAYSPDGALLASGSDDGAVRVWDIASRTTVWASERALHSVEAIAFTPDTGVILAGLSNGKVLFFAKDRWKKQRELESFNGGARPTRARGSVSSPPAGIATFVSGG